MKVKTDNETNLIIGLLNSEESAFAAVYNSYRPRLFSFASRFLKDKEMSEEVVQETLIILWTHRLELDQKYPLGPYLFTIARRLTLNALRNAATAVAAREKIWHQLGDAHNDTEESILLSDLQDFIDKALIHLTPQQQQVFKLSRYEGKTHEEIAEMLDISKNTVNNHLVEGLKKLRTRIEGAGSMRKLYLLF